MPRCARIFITNSGIDAFYPRMSNPQDRTGVMRRQLFQVADHDLRNTSAAPNVALPVAAIRPALPLAKEERATEWRGLLEQTLAEASLSHHYTQACAVCEGLGMAFEDELFDIAEEVAAKVGMKTLERKRFLKLVLG